MSRTSWGVDPLRFMEEARKWQENARVNAEFLRIGEICGKKLAEIHNQQVLEACFGKTEGGSNV